MPHHTWSPAVVNPWPVSDGRHLTVSFSTSIHRLGRYRRRSDGRLGHVSPRGRCTLVSPSVAEPINARLAEFQLWADGLEVSPSFG